MSGQDVQDAILTPMQRIFTAPKDYKTPEDQHAALREYVSALEHFSKEDLEAGWKGVVAIQTSRTWPMPGVFVVHAVRARHDREAMAGTDKRTVQGKRAREDFTAWQTVRKTALAAEAVRQGVAWSLKCAILNGVKAKDISLARLVREKQTADALERRLEKGQPLVDRTGRNIGIMKPAQAETALAMRHNIKLQEAETESEIRAVNDMQGSMPVEAEYADFLV